MESLPEIDFQRIRVHKHTRHGGFEELCVQLFRSKWTDAVEFTRVDGAGGDGGVEAYVTLRNGNKIGLQAKYFDKLDPKRWQQFDGSVRTALRNHPSLVEYHVAVPLNRSPAQKRQWDTRVRAWKPASPKPRRKVDFIWFGASEIEDELTTPKHRDKLLYWFGCLQFSDVWLDQCNTAAISDLDCRYTPQRHVRTESEKLMDAFARKEEFIRDYYRRVRKMFDGARKLAESLKGHKLQQVAPAECNEYGAALAKSDGAFGDGKTLPRFKSVLAACECLEKAGDKLEMRVCEINRAEKPPDKEMQASWQQRPYDYTITLLRRAWEAVNGLKSFVTHYACADSQKLFISGDAGSGKSHLLASAVTEARKHGRPALLLLGEHFLTAAEPWSQMVAKLGWEGTANQLLSALNHAAAICRQPALICIDALNESTERSLWRSHLNSLASKLDAYPNVRLAISCRSDFIEITMPDAISKGTDASWVKFQHLGFGDEIFEAVATYFAGYGIQTVHFPPLLEEFGNPLFLKTFCEAFQNTKLPSGPISLDMVMKKRVANVCEKLLHDIDCPTEVTRKAIELVANSIERAKNFRVSKDELRPKLDALFPVTGETKSLYRHLRSNGLLVEVGSYGLDGTTDIKVRFPYERFSDYFIADRMLQPFKTWVQLRRAWTKDGTLNRFGDPNCYYSSRGVMRALAILLPERLGLELAGLVKRQQFTRGLLEDFLSSLPWRSPQSFTKESRSLLRVSERLGLDKFLDAALRVATVPGHPYNAEFLHQCLRKMKVAQRDKVWTTEISKMTVWGGEGMPDLLVKWAFRVPLHLVSDEQALLAGRILTWFFASNHQGFRLRATLAAIRLLQGRCDAVVLLLRDFSECNDPYVTERVFAVACGVAMREQREEKLRELAKITFDLVFNRPMVPAHILLRDYARSILEIAHYRKCLPDAISPDQFRPPYRSRWPAIWSEAKVAPLEKDEGWREIECSVQPECTGSYGDFGRYVMQSAVHCFSAHPLNKKFPKGDKEAFDAMTARRWVLQRVKQLGWTPKDFGEYERRLPCRGQQRVDIEEVRVERISKKYQWIALRELQAFLSDHRHVALDWGENEPTLFEGAWQFWARDFDPSQPLKDLSEDTDGENNDSQAKQLPWWNRYADPFADEQLASNREAWLTKAPEDFRTLIELHSTPNAAGEFLSLAGYYPWKEELPYNKDERNIGRLGMWVHLRSWLVRRKELDAFLSQVKKVHFYGHRCQLVGIGSGWIGEYPWGSVFQSLHHFCSETDEWLSAVTVPAIQTVCHQEEKVWGIFPSPQLCEILEARWAGKEFEFVNAAGALVSFSPFKGRNEGTAPCIVARNELLDRLHKIGWEIVWGIAGQRYCYSSERSLHIVGKDAQFSAVYHTVGGKVVGGLTKHLIQDVPQRI